MLALCCLVPDRAPTASAAGPDPVADAPPFRLVLASPVVVFRRVQDHADAVARIELRNDGGRAVRVESVRVTFLAGDRRLRTDNLDSTVFGAGVAERPRRVEPGARVDWEGVCLDRPPEGADAARFDLDLSSRIGLRRVRWSDSAEAHLRPAPEPRSLRLPFDGYWLVTQGHACGTNHRLGGFGGDYAWDFVHFSSSGRAVRESYEATGRNADSFTFGLPVLAPADGRVLRVVDQVPDNEGLKDYPKRTLLEELNRPEWIFGNFVVLDVGEHVYALLGHLERGSVAVAPGDTVRAGDPVGRCGNSGNTFRPHVHLQLMDRADPTDPGISGLPGRFADFREITFAGDSTHKDILARHVAEGDPPEGSIVVTAGADGEKR